MGFLLLSLKLKVDYEQTIRKQFRAMKRITFLFSSGASILVILLAFLGILSTWHVRAFCIRGIDVAVNGVATVGRSAETVLGRIDTIVSKTLPSAVDAVQPLLTGQPEIDQDSEAVRDKATRHLVTSLLPQLEQLQSTAQTISQMAVSANETLALADTLLPTQLPRLPEDTWQSIDQRLVSLQENAKELADRLMSEKDAGYTGPDVTLQENIQALGELSNDLNVRIENTQSGLRTISEKIEVVRGKMHRWVTYLTLAVLLVLAWIAAGQIYLLWHFRNVQ